jgi:hypothetical protein
MAQKRFITRYCVIPSEVKALVLEKSIDQHRSLMNVRPILNLSNEELGYVRARDDPIPLLRGMRKGLVTSCPWPPERTPSRAIVRSSPLSWIKRSCKLLSS